LIPGHAGAAEADNTTVHRGFHPFANEQPESPNIILLRLFVSFTAPFVWLHYYGSIVMAPLLWLHCYGSIVMAPLLWLHCYGSIVMAPLLWLHSYGSILTAPFLRLHCYGCVFFYCCLYSFVSQCLLSRSVALTSLLRLSITLRSRKQRSRSGLRMFSGSPPRACMPSRGVEAPLSIRTSLFSFVQVFFLLFCCCVAGDDKLKFHGF
jgi:hypothetical protein